MSVTINGSTGVSLVQDGVIVTADMATSVPLGAKNRIINGNMAIDQRNAGAAVVNNGHAVDRMFSERSGAVGAISSQRVTDAPTGFLNSMKVTASTGTGVLASGDFSVISQHIEGNIIADLDFGKATARSITVSFWVKATTIGVYSCTLYNSGASRINPQPFTINTTVTWEKKTITFSGDVTGTWLTDTGRGITLNIYTALGTNYQGTAGWNTTGIYGVTGSTNAFVTTGNTFAITGVQLEEGSTATAFEHRMYGQELSLCQRYYQTYPAPPLRGVVLNSTQCNRMAMSLPVVMRAAPTVVLGNSSVYDGGATPQITGQAGNYTTSTVLEMDLSFSGGGLTALRPAMVFQSGSIPFTLSSEP